MKNFAVTVFGALSSFMTAIGLSLIEQRFGVAVYTYSVWIVVPIGAIGAGFLAASGYYLGARLVGHRPTGFLLFNMVLVSVMTFFLILYLSYSTLQVAGRRASDLVVTFPEYLDLIIQQAEFRTFQAGERRHSGPLGRWGYGIAALEVFGFAFGGFSVFGYLVTLPYCGPCGRYLACRGRQTRYAEGDDALAATARDVAALIVADRLPEAVEVQARSGPRKRGRGHLRSVLSLRQCGAATTAGAPSANSRSATTSTRTWCR